MMKTFRRILTPLLLVFGLLSSTAPAQSLDLGPSSNYLIRITPEAKAVIEKTIIQYGGKVEARYQYVFDGFLVKLPVIKDLSLLVIFLTLQMKMS
jgi:hypothetical protein